jgi:hypothetical protein
MKKTGCAIAITFVFLATICSCDIINPAEDIPSYVKIDTFLVSVDNFDQGSASHMITDIWLSVGGTNMGVFVMPFNIPSLETGFQTLTIRPGIKLNGISASRIAYPFYKPYIIDLNLVPGEINEITPSSTYKDECKFPFIEDFEDPGVGFTYSSYTDTTFEIQRKVVREGRSSGAIYLTKDVTNFEAWFNEDLALPENATPVLLEFDYKNNNGFQVGMYLIDGGVLEWYGLVYVRPSETWKRFYVDLGTVSTYQFETDLYRISFLAMHEQEDSTVTGEIFLDNIKVIHY